MPTIHVRVRDLPLFYPIAINSNQSNMASQHTINSLLWRRMTKRYVCLENPHNFVFFFFFPVSCWMPSTFLYACASVTIGIHCFGDEDAVKALLFLAFSLWTIRTRLFEWTLATMFGYQTNDTFFESITTCEYSLTYAYFLFFKCGNCLGRYISRLMNGRDRYAFSKNSEIPITFPHFRKQRNGLSNFK